MSQTDCGPGSSVEKTVTLRAFFDKCIIDYNIKTVNDIGCGDLYWITLDNREIDYIGYDSLIRTKALERLRHGWELVFGDVKSVNLRSCDLSLCKDVFRHHDNDGIEAILSNIKKSSKYLLCDYDLEHKITDSWHEDLKDGQPYDISGNRVDVRRYLGEPLISCPSNEGEIKRYGLWKFLS